MENAITEFFGSEPISEGYVDSDRHSSWYYESDRLKYELILDRKSLTVSISGDFEMAFQGMSLFEICVPYETIAIEKEELFYGQRPILVFRCSNDIDDNYKSLMIMKWDNGELSVWPNDSVAHKAIIDAWDK